MFSGYGFSETVRLTLISFARGAGCIFIEMFQGQPLFPGVSNVFEQLEKIWEVREEFLFGRRNTCISNFKPNLPLRQMMQSICFEILSYVVRLWRLWYLLQV